MIFRIKDGNTIRSFNIPEGTPVTSVNGQTGDVTGIQTQSITDAGGYFTTDTVEAALQELGATVDGIETLLAAI